jgi:gliding motility-associated-like protein
MKKLLHGIALLSVLFLLPLAAAALTISETHTNVYCNGASTGAIDITAAGGSAPYTYNWGDGATIEDRAALSAGNYPVTVTDNLGVTSSLLITITESSAITTAFAVTSVYCGGGSTGVIDLTAAGGNNPYAYAWNDFVYTEDRTNLTAAVYYVTVTDVRGCTKVDSANVTQPPGMVINKTITNVTCGSGANGAIDLTVQFGFPAYTYLWNDGVTTQDRTAIAAGNYSVTVADLSGCTVSATATVGQSGGGMAVNTTSVNPSCFGGTNGTITVTSVIGSVGPFTFRWSDGPTTQNRTGISAGSYTVTATSTTGCTAAATINLTQPAVLAVTLTPIQLTCFGSNNGAINTTVTGGTTAYSYNWGGVFTQNRTGLATGNYTVTVTDFRGCTATQTTFVPQPLQLTITATPSPQACIGGPTGSVTTSVAGGVGSYSYWWGAGIVTPNLNNVNAGNYSVTVTDGNGCSASATSTVLAYTPMVLTSTQVNNACYSGVNGSVDLSVANGWSPFTYAWSSSSTTQDINSLAAGSYTVTVSDNHSCTATRTVTITQPSFPISINAIVSDVTCNGGNSGAINVSVSNGAAPYSYNWGGVTTQNRTGLSAGNYPLTVTDNNSCSVSTSITLNQATPISITPTVTSTTCFGGSTGAINLAITGGSAPYTYLWNNGAVTQNRTGLAAGSYPVTVTDNHTCTATVTAVVGEPTAVTITPTVVNLSCNNSSTGSINIAVAGGTSPYTFAWNGGQVSQSRNALAAGTYTVTATDNAGCTASNTSTVAQPTAIAVSSINTDVSCNAGNNGAINLTITGGTVPYTFVWNGGSTAQNRTSLTAGTYTVTVTDNANCTASYSTTIAQSTTLSVSATVTDVSCNGGSNGAINTSVTGGTLPYTYDWGGSISTPNRTGLAAGTYGVTVTDNSGCSAIHSSIVSQSSAVVISSTVTNVSCFGGSNGAITTSVSGGTSPYTCNWGAGITTPNRTGLTAGTYVVTVTDNASCTVTQSSSITQGAAISIAPTVTNGTCFGGSNGTITIAVTGGTSPYTFNWGGSVNMQNRTGLSAGSYNVTVTDNANCTATSSSAVGQATAIAVSSTATNVVCNGGNTGVVNLTVTGGTSPYTYVWTGGATTPNRTGLTAGTYPVTVTDNNSCTASTTTSITQPSAISLSTTTTNVACFGDSTGSISLNVTGGASGYTFNWNNGPVTQNNSNIPSGNYSVIVNDANACSATASATITQAAPITTSTTVVNATCFGSANGSVDLTVNGGAGSYTYVWSNGFTTQDVSGFAANTYSVTVKDAGNCTALTSATISEPTQIVISATSLNASCNGSANGSIDITVTGGSSNYTYLWTNGAVTQDVSALVAQNYTVTATDNSACSATSTIAITQPSAIAASHTHTDVSCTGVNNGSIDLTVTGGSSPYTYSWSNGAVTQDLNSLVANTYSVTITDNAACTAAAAPVTIVQGASITLTETHQPFACANHAGAIDLTVIGGTAPYNFSWNGGVATEDRTNLAPGNYSVVVTDAHTCSATTSVAISQLAPLSTSINSTNVTCHGGNNGAIALFVQGGTAPYTFDWNQGASTAALSNLVAANYRVLVVDSNSCNAIDSASIIQPAAIQITKNVNDVTCSGMANGGIDVSVTGGASGYSYNWNTTDTTQDITNLQRGNYELTVTDAHSCTATSSSILVSEPQPLNIVSTITPIGCAANNDGAVQLQVAGGAQPFTYTWSNSSSSQNLTNLSTGNYDVTIIDSRGCTANGTYTVGVTPPMAITSLVRNTACATVQNGAIDLSITGGSSAYSFDWSNGAVTEDLTGISQGVYAVTVTDARNCSVQGTYSIATDYVLTVDATPSTTINLGEAVQLTAVTNVDHTNTYTWSPAVSLVCGTCATTQATPTQNTFYTINVIDANGCQATDTLTVTVNSITDIFIPNAFTPNGDGNNDALQLFGDLSAVAYLDFMVFNRWGEKVFESSNANFAWDGTYKGELVPQGVYIYTAKMVFINGYSRPDMKGSLTVIR